MSNETESLPRGWSARQEHKEARQAAKTSPEAIATRDHIREQRAALLATKEKETDL